MAAVISFTPAQAWLVASLAGTHNVSLTNYDNTSYPSIAQTSKGTEINGSFVEFSSGALTITDTGISDGEAYIYVYISGGTTVLAEATNTAPTYDVTKSGWYDAGGTKRCVAAMTKSGASYTKKRLVRDLEVDIDSFTGGDGNLYVENELLIDGEITASSVINCQTIDTGNGATEVYDMDQDLKTTDNVEFEQLTLGSVISKGETVPIPSLGAVARCIKVTADGVTRYIRLHPEA